MIKVGQIYKIFNVNQVITLIEKTYGRYWWVSMINKNGSPSGMFCKKICLVINLLPNIRLGKKPLIQRSLTMP